MRRIEIIEDDGRVDVDCASCGGVMIALGLLRLAEAIVVKMATPQWPERIEEKDAPEK